MIFLEDFMRLPDFGKALDNLIPEYRAQFSLAARLEKWTGKRSMSV